MFTVNASTKRTPVFAMVAMAAALSGYATMPAYAAGWPEKAIEVVVPYTPGGATDTVTRIVMKKLSDRLGQPVIVNNKPGANSTIGTAMVARAKPDGYSFVTVLAAYTVNPHLYKLSYSFDDFEPVSHMADLPLFLFVSKDLPVNSLAELVEYGKKNPDALTYASSGTGSSAHLTGANFGLQAGLKMTHIPYKGSAPILTDLLSNRVSMVFDPILVPMQYVKEGKLKVLAVTSAKRWEDEPNIPTMGEAGFPGFVMNSWVSLMAPAGTPKDIVERVSTEIAAIVKEDDVKKLFNDAGFVPVGGSAAELTELIKKDTAMYGEIVRKADIKLN
ncbi:MFS transporter [Pollutimonas subterranea]|uniref:MFS transporter n=1 Tax=Pollutimonas subterranea TaxID=2045210 RepID=A0A2N4U6N7_9BURK|nr:tripartite tricarboxylate transporter substrate binding protein [Pollutimonas subterranea]PLC50692.1 MFS transporter [Pollutimonas subterranea]